MATQQAKIRQANKNTARRSNQLADLALEIDDDVYANKSTGLLKGPDLKKNGLTVKIPLWQNLPPDDGVESDKVQFWIDRGTGTFVEVGPLLEFVRQPGETELPGFPFPVTILPSDFPRDDSCRLKYTWRPYTNGPALDSLIYTFICDLVDPYDDEPPKLPLIAVDYLDDTNLPVGSELDVIIPGYPLWQSTDKIGFWVVNEHDIPEDPRLVPPNHATTVPAPGTSDTTIKIPADVFRKLGDMPAMVTYGLVDQAGNPSQLSFYKKMPLTWGLLPQPIGKPEVPKADPVLTMQGVREGVEVFITKPLNFKTGDEVRLKWGGHTLTPDIPLGNNPMPSIGLAVLPATLMLEDYGRTTVGIKSTNVSYHIVRSGRLFGPADDDFDVNLQVLLPWPDPWPPVDWPDPVHPALLEGEVVNHDGTRFNTLTRADKDEDATFHFDWYDDATDGHIVNFYWNGLLVTEARTVFDDQNPEHKPGGAYKVTIPWAYILAGMNGDVLVHYTVSGPGIVNDLESTPTNVEVNAIAVDLPAAKFPTIETAGNPNYPGCDALEADGSLKVSIPDLTGLLKDGDVIEVVFTPMKGENLANPEEPITSGILRKNFTIGAADSPVTGFEFLVTPYVKHILPLYTENPNRRGRVKIQYSFNDGTENILSTPQVNRTAFHGANDPCIVPPRK